MNTDHWKYFKEFAWYEILTGGPDPQLATVNAMSSGVSFHELVWRAGCYVSVYNVPGAEVLWRNWPYEKALLNHGIPEPWLESVWENIPTRFERRCIRRPEWLAKFLSDYIGWMGNLPDTKDYETWWQSCQTVKFMGRYVAIKLLEFLHTYANLVDTVPDIRAKGGWSPVKTLGLLEGRQIDTVEDAEQTAARLRTRLFEENGLTVSFFQLQVLLCEYRESYEGRRQYPGRSLDSELNYLSKIKNFWEGEGLISEMPAARKAAFPNRCLGELNNWQTVRKELGKTLRDHGYTWSDFIYKYQPDMELDKPNENLFN